MILTRGLLSVLILLCVLLPTPASASSLDGVVWIEVERHRPTNFHGHTLPKQGEGMGVAIAQSQIATAAHVVFAAERITVQDANGNTMRAHVIKMDDAHDIALLKITAMLPSVAIRTYPIASGERVGAFTITKPYRELGEAVLAAKYPSNGIPTPLIFTGIKGEKGMSGGGLFDEHGRVVGIIVRIDRLGYMSAVPMGTFCRQLACPGD